MSDRPLGVAIAQLGQWFRHWSYEEVHSRLLWYRDFVNLGAASRLLDIGYQAVGAAIEVDQGRGWYEARECDTEGNPRTGRPAVEYRGLPKTH